MTTSTKALRRILVIDDEPNIVRAIERQLDTTTQGRYLFQVSGFTEPAKALAALQNEHFDAVISDYMMAEMDGLSLLKLARKIQPACPLIVLSGQTDAKTLYKMVNEAHIFSFIGKPWHDYFLKSTLTQALNYAGKVHRYHHLASLVRKNDMHLPLETDGEAQRVLVVIHNDHELEHARQTLCHHLKSEDLFEAVRSALSLETGEALHDCPIEVKTATSAAQAIALAKEIEFSCVIADSRLPEMSGTQLLQHFHDIQPNCTRLLIGESSEMNEMVDALDSAHIFGFINKNWNDFELKFRVAKALSHNHILMENEALAAVLETIGISDQES